MEASARNYFTKNISFRISHISFQGSKGSPVNIYLFKVSKRNTRKRYKICSELIT